MKILLADIDSKIPNLCLMKISAWHKANGDSVEIQKFNQPYYPRRIQKWCHISDGFDKVYISVVFDGHKEMIKPPKDSDIEIGGTGWNLETNLPQHIEDMEPDYAIYGEQKISYGFITRGCIRNCYFCNVPKKEGMIRLVNEPAKIVKHGIAKFMDNNIFAYPEHKDILIELARIGVRYEFMQGYDIRLLDSQNSELLRRAKHFENHYTFAFDDWKYRDLIADKLKLLYWRKKYRIRFYVYVHPKMELSDTVNRIQWLNDHECLPYIMRDIACWGDPRKNIFTDMAAWCNNPRIFRKLSFDEFLNIRHTKKARIYESISAWIEAGGRMRGGL